MGYENHFGVFDNLNWMLKFFQIKYFDVDTHGAFDSGSVYFIIECQGHPFFGPALDK